MTSRRRSSSGHSNDADRKTVAVVVTDVKKSFYVSYFGHVFTFFNGFYFPNVFLFEKTLAKFRAASRLTTTTTTTI